MSLAAIDPMVHPTADVTAATPTREDLVPNGNGLPVPVHTPMASVIAFALAGPGSMTMALLLCIGLTQIGGGASMSLWSLGLGTAFALWLPSLAIALWAANAREEWGR